ncbi:MAG: hypothetical protein WAO24_03940 [Peptococcia bacterium]
MSRTDNAESVFKCQDCGAMFSRDNEKTKPCPQCGYICTVERCPVIGASNEDY